MARTLRTSNLTISVPTDFSTIQAAINSIYRDYDFGGQYGATINVADGTYTENIEAAYWPAGWGPDSFLQLTGNPTTPGNCKIEPSSGTAIEVEYWANLKISGFRIKGGISVYDGGRFENNGKIELDTAGSALVYGFQLADIRIGAAVDIIGGGQYAFRVEGNSTFAANNQTINIASSGLNFSNAFVAAGRCSAMNFNGTSFTGNSVTGKRWISDGNSMLKVWGANPDTLFPGNVNGTKTLGGECG